MKVGIAHAEPRVRARLAEVIRDGFDIVCSWEVGDSEGLWARVHEERPKIILLSLDLPGEALPVLTHRLVDETQTAILLLEGEGHVDVATVFDCLGQGATDVARLPLRADQAPSEAYENFRDRFATLRTLALHGQTTEATPQLKSEPFAISSSPPLVAMGASTGGPRALATVLEGLPPGFPAAVVIVQHLDAHFYRGLAEWLDHTCVLPVHPVEEPTSLLPGHVYVAARSEHMILAPDDRLCFTRERSDLVCRPSIDVLFNSIAAIPRTRGVAALMTGMGRDGAEGLLALRRAGYETLAQDEASSVVYGMPRAAHELGAAVRVLSPQRMARHIVDTILSRPLTASASRNAP